MTKTPAEEEEEERRRRSSIAPGVGSGEEEPAGRESETRNVEPSQGDNQKKGGGNAIYWGAASVAAGLIAGPLGVGVVIGAKIDDMSTFAKIGVAILGVFIPPLGIGMAIGYGGKKLYEKMSSQKTESPALLEGIHRAKKKPGLGEGREVPLNPEVAREVE
ncbi:MAG: hypothetical protein KA998_04250, partial [Rickettsiaceae bacterium]|nr:hypothetical protein [Rickettsiaceae bacterium]